METRPNDQELSPEDILEKAAEFDRSADLIADPHLKALFKALAADARLEARGKYRSRS